MYHEVRYLPYGKKDKDQDGVWVNKDIWQADEDYILSPEDYEHLEGAGSAHYRIVHNQSIYRGRNYGLFGILADVRWTPQKPIRRPKGVAPGCSYQTMGEILRYGSDGHSHSYLTLRELEEYDWEGYTVKETESLTLKELEELKSQYPNRTFTIKEEPESEDWPYYVVEWDAPYSYVAGSFYTETLPRLRSYVDNNLDVTPDDIRIVFFFDS